MLNAQQELVNARVALVTAQHDRVVASYTLLAAVGALSMQRLGLNVQVYDPMVHYQQVRDAWAGLRNPTDAESYAICFADVRVTARLASTAEMARYATSALLMD